MEYPTIVKHVAQLNKDILHTHLGGFTAQFYPMSDEGRIDGLLALITTSGSVVSWCSILPQLVGSMCSLLVTISASVILIDNLHQELIMS